jgi:2-phosphoglycerate kinase
MSDRLALANAIEDAGIERAKAERIASTIVDLIHDNVATKVDIGELRGEIRLVRTELGQAKSELSARTDLVEHRLMTRLGGLVVVLAGVVLGALRLWLPH